MPYQAPVSSILFCLQHMVGLEELIATGQYPELADGTADAVLEEAARMLEHHVVPAHRVADTEGARFENGVVRTPAEFHTAFTALRDGGWVGIGAPTDAGGMGLPQSVVTPFNEMLGSACLALSLGPLLTQGVILALKLHGTAEQQALYLPKLSSGEWAGTMNLTEAHAGSDVGALRTKAEPNDNGSWSITGQKIFISWGDSDLTENIIHLVLARTPGSPAGTAGISLFLVPKILPTESGDLGVHNQVKTLSLEHKMGLHGSPTVVLSYEGAQGWLVGEEHAGMACMFTMMNAARLGVGLQGVSVAEPACQQATAYASERVQGKPRGADGPIIEHEDVRRMVLTMRVLTEVARALCYDLAVQIDLANADLEPERKAKAAARVALLTPLAKGFGSEVGCQVADLGIQVHGGAGFIEETGAAQYFRDVRVAAIYEGTNGIQAMDLVGRKLTADGGAAVLELLAETNATIEQLKREHSDLERTASRMREGIDCAESSTDWMVNTATDTDRRAGAMAYLRLLSLARGAHYLARGALAEHDCRSQAAAAAFYANHIVPQVSGLDNSIRAGGDSLYEYPTSKLHG